MLTGDQSAVAQSVAKELGVDEVHAELLPGDKVEQVERLMKQKPEGAMLAFVGDGINDAPVLRRAPTWALPWAQSVRMPPLKRRMLCLWMTIHASCPVPSVSPGAPCALPISNHHFRIVSVKAIILVMGAMGLANMWLAVFADVGVSFLAILNAMRAMRAK